MLNRPLAKTYPPGSTFKIVTLSAALSSGKYTTHHEDPRARRLDLPQTTATLPNYDGKPCFGGQVTLEQALQISCNTAFANVGLTLGADALQAQAETFGFNHSFDVPMTAATSVFPSDLNAPQTAQAAIGQFDVRATALQMAMVAAGVANHGVVMQPYLVDQLNAPDLAPLDAAHHAAGVRRGGHARGRRRADRHAGQRRARTAPGKSAQIVGVDVAGKTGTAQTPTASHRTPGSCPSRRRRPRRSRSPSSSRTAATSGTRPPAASCRRPIAKAVMEAVLK